MRAPVERSDYESWFYSEAPAQDPHATGLWWNDYRARAFALPERLHPTTWTGETAVRFLKSYDSRKPFLLKVSFIRPHSPYDPPERFLRMYEDADIPEAHVGKWAARYEPRNSGHHDIWRGKLSPETIRRSRQGYYGCVTHVGEQIGRILDVLDERKFLEETLIVFTSDHGDMTGDQNLWRKSYAYEPSAHIPMLMRWPAGLVSARRGRLCRTRSSFAIFCRPSLAIAGAPASRPIDGRSLFSLLRLNGAKWREYIDQ